MLAASITFTICTYFKICWSSFFHSTHYTIIQRQFQFSLHRKIQQNKCFCSLFVLCLQISIIWIRGIGVGKDRETPSRYVVPRNQYVEVRYGIVLCTRLLENANGVSGVLQLCVAEVPTVLNFGGALVPSAFSGSVHDKRRGYLRELILKPIQNITW